jgi:hypothetical protein
MAEQDQIITSLREKVKKIVSIYEIKKNENIKLLQEIDLLKEKINLIKSENQTLEEKYNTLKLAKTIASSPEDSHEAKLKVNKIVREIDKCIALLNR